MKKFYVIGLLALFVLGIAAGWDTIRRAGAEIIELFYSDPDMGPFNKGDLSKEQFMLLRAEGIAMRRGVDDEKSFDPRQRVEALGQLKKQEMRRLEMPASRAREALLAPWKEIGPNPIPNGQVQAGPQTAVSGRTIAIAIHPTNSDIVYVGTAQGGLYRTTDGGGSWTPLMDDQLSLAIGAIAIAPSQPETIYVGTGEHNFSADSFFGVGVYRIDNASTTADISGPLNLNSNGADVFTGRGISRVVVHPSDPATIFVATTSGIGGLGAASNVVLPGRGIYRSNNATSANPTFSKLTGLSNNANSSVRDIAIDPLDPNLMVAAVVQGNGAGGIYVSDNAQAQSPIFTQRAVFDSSLTSELTAEFAIQHNSGPDPVIYAAVGNLGGRVLVSTDRGVTWTQRIDNDFCTPQCFYNIAIAVDPTDASKVYLGGTGNVTFGFSLDGGLQFTPSQNGLHTDTHVIEVAPSNPQTIYFGSDGGIYRSINGGLTWQTLNNTTFRATQFMSVAVHPTDPNFSIGGTQDNGTLLYRPDGTWNRVDFGDGGFAVIDQSAANTTDVNMYHTYFNRSETLQGYAFSSNGINPTEGTWIRRGCSSSGNTVNGITCNGSILFYAPLEQGPGVPNTIYYGSDRLYRSADRGLNHTVVSQNPIVSSGCGASGTASCAISAIGISPQNDDVRVVGLQNGAIFGTANGGSTLADLDPLNHVPNNYVARAVIDPSDPGTVYVTLSAFGVVSVWKSNNWSTASPTWTAAATGLPPVPINAFVIDPLNSDTLYAGTDIGVYMSPNAGVTWEPLGTGLPRVAVFDMAITNGTPRKIRIATHGRGMWDYTLAAAAPFASLSGRIYTPDARGLRNAIVTLTDAANERRTVTTGSLGFFNFADVPAGAAYRLSVTSKRYRFNSRTIQVEADIAGADFTGQE